MPPVRAFVAIGDQMGFERLVAASTTTEAFVAQETVNPNPLVCRPKLGAVAKIVGFGRTQRAVGRPPKLGPHPVVPGRK